MSLKLNPSAIINHLNEIAMSLLEDSLKYVNKVYKISKVFIVNILLFGKQDVYTSLLQVTKNPIMVEK